MSDKIIYTCKRIVNDDENDDNDDNQCQNMVRIN